MRSQLSRIFYLIAAIAFAFVLATAPVMAGDTVLSNNSDTENEIFFISDEPSLVINGFDLTPLSLLLPVALDAVSISVDTPVPGSSTTLVVYQDGNGGSPLDATLVYQEAVTLNQIGINRIELATAAIITEPVVWVGFYLPVDLRFHADQSGSSVLTYWAWTAGGTFDLTSLANAAVLGPGDGTEPVGITMDGVARITAELRTPEYQETAASLPLGTQLVANVGQDTSILQNYTNCASLLYDPDDIAITGGNSFTLDCATANEVDAPVTIAQPQDQVLDLQRTGPMYKLSAAIPETLQITGAVNTLPVPVTHCMRIATGDLETAVLGEARGIPERWHILPTVRFDNIVCAEVTVANYISYFLPRTPESPPNVNLVVSWTRIDPHPLKCGIRTSIPLNVVNTGSSWFETDSGTIAFSVKDVHIATGIITSQRERRIPTARFGPGDRRIVELGPLYVITYVDELHRLEITADVYNEVIETNEFDNGWITEYILALPDGSDTCADPNAT